MKTFMETVKKQAQYPNPAYDMCSYAKTRWHAWKKQNRIKD